MRAAWVSPTGIGPDGYRRTGGEPRDDVTSTEAAYIGLLCGLNAALHLRIRDIVVHGDGDAGELVIKQCCDQSIPRKFGTSEPFIVWAISQLGLPPHCAQILSRRCVADARGEAAKLRTLHHAATQFLKCFNFRLEATLSGKQHTARAEALAERGRLGQAPEGGRHSTVSWEGKVDTAEAWTSSHLTRFSDKVAFPALLLPPGRAKDATHYIPAFEQRRNYDDGEQPWHWRRVVDGERTRTRVHCLQDLIRRCQTNKTLEKACAMVARGGRGAYVKCRRCEVWIGMAHKKYHGYARMVETITEWVVVLPPGNPCGSHILIRWYRFEMIWNNGSMGPDGFEVQYGDRETGHQCSWAVLNDADEVPFSKAYKPLHSPRVLSGIARYDLVKPNTTEYTTACKESFDELRALLGSREGASGGGRRGSASRGEEEMEVDDGEYRREEEEAEPGDGGGGGGAARGGASGARGGGEKDGAVSRGGGAMRDPSHRPADPQPLHNCGLSDGG
mmetsp:Transcript_16838/g.41385  ORF Transcript_16838/g.41385 Transcript_16838/m.41385 type:complete len:503 (-) Transcript_16838:165-1673(-)